MERLPLSPNGKVDRAALPVPAADAALAEREVVPPATETEKALAAIWAEVLRTDRIGRDTDLLLAGADSLQIFQIAARANRAGLLVTAKQLLQDRTLATVAAALDAVRAAPAAPTAPDSLPSLAQFRRARRNA
jgi:aryl carrier-like protein